MRKKLLSISNLANQGFEQEPPSSIHTLSEDGTFTLLFQVDPGSEVVTICISHRGINYMESAVEIEKSYFVNAIIRPLEHLVIQNKLNHVFRKLLKDMHSRMEKDLS
ncbi:MAG: hypothetical protein EOP04_15965 [Proteobacteria bacterium]|nr:MAG: hypothetical protein EOP04_15965 [Pseudomonadota bacterium]